MPPNQVGYACCAGFCAAFGLPAYIPNSNRDPRVPDILLHVAQFYYLGSLTWFKAQLMGPVNGSCEVVAGP